MPELELAAEPVVFVVDDDEAVCESLGCLLRSQGLNVRTFLSAEEFLAQYRPHQPGCLVLDLRMRGMSGLELQARLVRQTLSLPVIIVTGHGDIPMAVRAVRAGVVDFLEKPVSDELLLRRIRLALDIDGRQREQQREQEGFAARLATLTGREREVMELVLVGHANKQIAAKLGVKEKTVEVHRKHLLKKMGVRNAVQLVQVLLVARPRGAPRGTG
jgi:FixJ family two-component response regulator